jgi:hypothetical protein
VSSTQIRQAVAKRGRSLEKLVPEPVAEYIRKLHLYKPGEALEATPAARERKGLHVVGGREHRKR